ncbi:MAG TPA: bifunctional oligoribonuclease/PAP phosphatase NrnA [Clostridiaceae bacterium]|nr:bifunctional oligoribonuclease/PAP phosphatase NrnA [Clostridiaceae bacterium]
MSSKQDIRRRLLEVVLDLASEGGSIAFLPHERFDPDAIGASISLAEVFRAIGCKTTVLTDAEPPALMSHLPLLETLQVFEPGLTCSSFDLALAIDCHETDRVGARAECLTQSRLRGSVDHHVISSDLGRLDFVVPSASSTCELAFEIIWDLELHLAKPLFNKDIAVLLLAGAITDTGRYAYSSTTPLAFRQAAFLLERFDVDLTTLHHELFDRTTVGRLQIKGDIFSRIVTIEGGRILVASVTCDMLERRGVTDNDLTNFASEMRAADGVEVAFLFIEMENPPGVRINIRSNGCFNAAKFAIQFGGGGHVRAAGVTLNNTALDEAKELILQEAKRHLDECMGELDS